MVLALEVAGRELPSFGVIAIAVAFMFGFLVLSRAQGHNAPAESRGVGMSRQCENCGRRFQPQRVEVLASGRERTIYEERCPTCGWDNDWNTQRERRERRGARGGW